MTVRLTPRPPASFTQPREQLLAQRFPADYGNKGEQTMQAGNAVSCNVAQWVGERVKAVLS